MLVDSSFKFLPNVTPASASVGPDPVSVSHTFQTHQTSGFQWEGKRMQRASFECVVRVAGFRKSYLSIACRVFLVALEFNDKDFMRLDTISTARGPIARRTVRRQGKMKSGTTSIVVVLAVVKRCPKLAAKWIIPTGVSKLIRLLRALLRGHPLFFGFLGQIRRRAHHLLRVLAQF